MKIYTLGTSHGNATLSRFNTSTVYETEEGELYLVDAGEPAEALMRRAGLSLSRLRAVFITHMHDDHCGGLEKLCRMADKFGAVAPVPVYMPEEAGVYALLVWSRACHNELLTAVPTSYDEGVIYEDESVRVTAIRTRHLLVGGVGRSFAFLLHFKCDGVTVLHTGDLSHDFSDFPSLVQDTYVDVCLCEAVHYCPEDAAPLLQTAQIGKLIFHHVGDRWHLGDGSRGGMGEGPNALLATTAAYPYPTAVAADGSIFEFKGKKH